MLETIITAITSLLVGGGLSAIVCLKATKKKADIEADKSAVDLLQDSLDSIKEIADQYLQLYKEDEARIKELNNTIVMLSESKAVACQYICNRVCCSLRKPPRGQGEQFLKDYQAGNGELDYRTIDEFYEDKVSNQSNKLTETTTK